jgi:hypothetical protein
MLSGFDEKVEAEAGEKIKSFLTVLYATPWILAPTWSQGRGLRIAEDLAYLRRSMGDLVGDSVCAIGFNLGRGWLGKSLERDELQEMLWDLLKRGFKLYRGGTIGMDLVKQGAKALFGDLGDGGWGGLAPRLPPEMRGPATFFIALRLETLGRVGEAAKLMGEAHANAPADSPLRKLAGEELHRLQEAGGRKD